MLKHVALPFRGNRKRVAGTPGTLILHGAVKTGAEFGESHHRLNHIENIALQKQLTAGLEGGCNGQKQRGLQDPALAVAPFEPGIGELDGDPL